MPMRSAALAGDDDVTLGGPGLGWSRRRQAEAAVRRERRLANVHLAACSLVHTIASEVRTAIGNQLAE